MFANLPFSAEMKMSHAWKQSISINESIAGKLIESQQNIPINTIQLLDEGWDNLVYLVNGSIIFRFPRREMGLSCIENEIALLPYISKNVSFPLSVPFWIGKPSEIYPYPYAGYRMLPGKSVSDGASTLIDNSDFAITLASWLSELHTIPIRKKDFSAVKGEQEWRYNPSQRILLCKENLNRYEQYYAELGFSKITLQEIIEQLPRLNFSLNRKTYLHGDLYSRHVLINPETFMPSGLIDWGDIHIGHPGIDLAVGMIFTKKAFSVFLNAYQNVDRETLHLLLFHAFCHHMSFLPYTCEQNKSHLKKWASLVLTRVIEEIRLL